MMSPESLVQQNLKTCGTVIVLKVGHDVKEWITYLLKYGIELKGLIFDTMIADIYDHRSSYPITSLS